MKGESAPKEEKREKQQYATRVRHQNSIHREGKVQYSLYGLEASKVEESRREEKKKKALKIFCNK